MSAPVTDAAISAALAQYRLAAPHVVAAHEANKRNDNFLVDDGERRRYILRRYRRNPGEARMLFQLRFQQQLRKLGYPTSEVIEAASGDLFVPSEAGPWALFTFIEGDEYDFSRLGQTAEAGRRLAEFHRTSASIDLEDVVLDINVDVRLWWRRGEQELAVLAEMYRADGVDDEVAYLRRWHARLLDEWPLGRLEALPGGWVHSDFHGRNMVFVGDELRGLFDFDPLHRDFLAADIGHALFMFGREFRGSTTIRPHAARAFLEAYESVRPLGDEERAAIPMLAVLAWAPIAAYQELLLGDGEDSLAFFRHYVALMQQLEAEMERLALALTV